MAFDNVIDRDVSLKIKPHKPEGVMNQPIIFCNVYLENKEKFKGRQGVHIVGLTKGEAVALHEKLGVALGDEQRGIKR